ncbi:MAG TPA: cobalamin biosynthesis protein [Dehalococcoidia bacterium]|nr:cobalamin biosynthesis protein [Dehalococcoidia bacterium]
MGAEGAVRRPIAAVAITRRGAEMASVLARRLPAVELYVEERWAGGLGACCHAFRLPLRPLIGDLFARYPSLVLFTAVGVAVRLLAPLLSGKGRDPAVATVDEGGRFVVCLLSGHRGGGEALAREVASALGAVPVLTSASAALGLPALDLLGIDRGWRLEGEEDLTAVAAALVNGGPVAFYQDAGGRPWTEAPPGILEVPSLDDALALGAPRIVVSDRLLPDGIRDGAPTLVYRPRTLVAGVGCRRGVGGVRIAAFVRSVLEGNGLSPLSLRCLATAEAKAGEQGLKEAARLLNVPLLTLPADRLRRVAGLVSPSASERLLGLPSVSEASALAAAGAARLLVPRAKDGQVTVAVARWEGEA